MTRTKVDNDIQSKLKFLERMVEYIKADHTNHPIHPTHKIQEEIDRLKLKRKLKKLKSKSKIEETKTLISELTEIIKQKT